MQPRAVLGARVCSLLLPLIGPGFLMRARQQEEPSLGTLRRRGGPAEDKEEATPATLLRTTIAPSQRRKKRPTHPRPPQPHRATGVHSHTDPHAPEPCCVCRRRVGCPCVTARPRCFKEMSRNARGARSWLRERLIVKDEGPSRGHGGFSLPPQPRHH